MKRLFIDQKYRLILIYLSMAPSSAKLLHLCVDKNMDGTLILKHSRVNLLQKETTANHRFPSFPTQEAPA